MRQNRSGDNSVHWVSFVDLKVPNRFPASVGLQAVVWLLLVWLLLVGLLLSD